jgi:hypothetical protein
MIMSQAKLSVPRTTSSGKLDESKISICETKLRT